MKLFGKFSEYTINEIFLYATPFHSIQELIKKPGTNTIVKEYKPRKFKKILKDPAGIPYEEKVVEQDKSFRHQVVAIQDLGFAKISIYSLPMGRGEVKSLGLEPIENAVKKEKLELSIEKLSDDKYHARGVSVSTTDLTDDTVKGIVF